MKRRSNLARVSILYAILLIWLGMACATFTRVAPAVDITGRWKAEFEIPEGETEFEAPEGKLEVFLNIQKSPEGTLTATIDVPAFDAYDVPLIFSFENGVVHYEIDEVQVFFNGKLIDPSTIEGLQSQPGGGEPGPAIYKRVK